MVQHRRKYTDDYKAAAVERLYESGATQGSISSELGIAGIQLKTWRLEIEAFGSAEAKLRQKADGDEGWLYLAGIKDMATREIVGWAMDGHMRAELCCEALKMALGRRGPAPGLIHHSDRGSQYAGGKYRELIGNAHLTQSMVARANASITRRWKASLLH